MTKAREQKLKRRYGIDLLDFDRILEDQGGACFVCLEEFSDTRIPMVDHDHFSGLPRSILCNRCNSLLGFAEKTKNPLGTLRRATEYLEEVH